MEEYLDFIDTVKVDEITENARLVLQEYENRLDGETVYNIALEIDESDHFITHTTDLFESTDYCKVKTEYDKYVLIALAYKKGE